MDIGSIIDDLKRISRETDPEGLAEKLIALFEAAASFKSAGMYREAAYTAGFGLEPAHELLSRDPCLTPVENARRALEEFLTLPQISPSIDLDRVPLQPASPEEPGPYRAQFPAGTRVRIADEAALRQFQRGWHLHHPLSDEQLQFAGRTTVVSKVGYFHGGDALYSLVDTGNYLWHEACLLKT